MGRIRVIQVGAGRFGQSWLQTLKEYPDTDIAAVVDVLPDNLEAAESMLGSDGTKYSVNIEETLHNTNADLVLIVTPPSTHTDIAIQALEQGFHVMMEKPLAHSYEEAVHLLEASKRYDRKIAVSQNYRWRQPIQTLKKVIEEGIIGKIGYIEYDFRKPKKLGGWRDQYSDVMLEDMSIHHFDIMRFLLGREVVEVSAQSFRPEWSWFTGNPTASVSLLFEDNIFVNYFACWVSRGKETTWNGDIRIAGEYGAIELINDQVHVRIFDEDIEKEYRSIDLVETPFPELSFRDRGSSLNDMVNAIRENREPNTSLVDNFKSFEITCVAIKSSKKHGEKIVIGK